LAGPLAYIESPLSIEPLATLQPACAGAPDRTPGAPDKCPVHSGRPRASQLNVSRSSTTVANRYLAVMPAPDKTAYTAPGTGQMSGACSSRTPSSTESRPPPDKRAPDKLPVRCSVRCVRLSAKPPRVSHRTEKTCHQACPVPQQHLCPVLRTALSRLPESLAPPDRRHRTKSLCPVLCPVLLRALFSAPFSTLAYHHQHQSVPSPCARVLVFSQAFSQGC
jgi:hypothetical protein